MNGFERLPERVARRMQPDRYLTIYLNDHAAGAVAGARRAQRLAASSAGGLHADTLRALASDVEEDRQTLQAAMETMGVPTRRWKQVLGRVAEIAGMLKLNGRLLRRSPLSTLVELEALRIGVQGKLALWQALDAANPPGVDRVDLAVLEERARAQLTALTDVHRQIARDVLGDATDHGAGRDSDQDRTRSV